MKWEITDVVVFLGFFWEESISSGSFSKMWKKWKGKMRNFFNRRKKIVERRGVGGGNQGEIKWKGKIKDEKMENYVWGEAAEKRKFKR